MSSAAHVGASATHNGSDGVGAVVVNVLAEGCGVRQVPQRMRQTVATVLSPQSLSDKAEQPAGSKASHSVSAGGIAGFMEVWAVVVSTSDELELVLVL